MLFNNLSRFFGAHFNIGHLFFACFFDNSFVCIFINKSVNKTALEKMLGNDFCNIFFLNTAVECTFGVNDNNGAEGAKTETACLNNLNFFRETVLCDLVFEGGNEYLTAR